MRRTLKIQLTTTFTVISIVLFSLGILGPTSSYYNLFFYADVIVAEKIMSIGHIPSEVLTQNVAGGEASRLWLKTRTRLRTPLPSIMMVMYSQVTTIPLHIIHSLLPFSLFVLLTYYIIIRMFVHNYAILLSSIALIGPNISPQGFTSIMVVKLGILLLVVFSILKLQDLNEHKQATAFIFCTSSLSLVWAFFLYPSSFFSISIVLLAGMAALYLSHSKIRSQILLGSLVLSGFLISALFTQGFNAYINVFIKIATNILVLGFTSPFASQSLSVGAHTLSVPSYSLIAVAVTIVPGIIGGYIALKTAIDNIGKLSAYKWVFLCTWGGLLLIYGLIHLLVGEPWIASRVYNISFPVVMIGCSIAIGNYFSPSIISDNTIDHLQKFTMIVILVGFLSTWILIAASPHVDIHSTQIEQEYAADHITEFGQTLYSGDMKIGSILVSNGYQNYYYPQSEDELKNFFYNGSDEFCSIINEKRIERVVYYQDMEDVGFYINPYKRTPIKYQDQIDKNSHLYQNGRVSIISPEC